MKFKKYYVEEGCMAEYSKLPTELEFGGMKEEEFNKWFDEIKKSGYKYDAKRYCAEHGFILLIKEDSTEAERERGKQAIEEICKNDDIF